MILLTKKKQRELIQLISANQIIMNAFDTLGGLNKFEAYSQFCENSAQAIVNVGGIKALTEAQDYIFCTKSEIESND